MSLKLVKKGLGLLLATGEILNTTDEVEKSQKHILKKVSEVVLVLQNCAVAFMDACWWPAHDRSPHMYTYTLGVTRNN